MKPFVRESVAADETDIASIIESARQESGEHRGSPLEVPMGRERITLVAGAGESVFGALLASATSMDTWTIHLVHVIPAARGVGLGHSLVRQILEIVRARGGSTIVSAAQPGDRALKNLFESHGIVARTIIVGRDL